MEKLKIRIKVEENNEERFQYQEIMIDNEKDMKKYEKLKKRIQKFVKEMKSVKTNEPEITEIIGDISNDKNKIVNDEESNRNIEKDQAEKARNDINRNTRNMKQNENEDSEMNMKNTEQNKNKSYKINNKKQRKNTKSPETISDESENDEVNDNEE